MAASINCGDCHGAPPVNADNCGNNARGLHGTHVNYSSATYNKTVASYGKCAYCHPVTTGTTPTVTHNNNNLEVIGNMVGFINSTGLKYTSPNCTKSCHKNRAQSAKWGNYTATVVGGISLNCRSCHDDFTDKTGLSFAHNKHLLSNCTTPGAYGLMSAAANAGCANCHPDERNDLWGGGAKADNGTKKAYPHASDGTNVVAANATVSNNIISRTGTGSGSTCSNNCHKNTATATWGGTLACDACHYYAVSPTKPANDAAVVKLGGAHSSHFNSGIVCTSCHPTRSDNSHASSLLPKGYNAVVSKAGMTYNRASGKTCTNSGIGCHGVPVTPAGWDTGPCSYGCSICHYYPGGGARDWTAPNGHAVRYDSPVVSTHLKANINYDKCLDTYSSVVNDTNKCGQCHKTLKANHNNGVVNVAGSGSGNCGGNFTVNVVTPGSLVTCGSVKCHSGKITPNWW